MKKLLVLSIILCGISNFAYASVLGGYDAGAVNSTYVEDLRIHEALTRERMKNNSAIVKTKTAPKTEQQIVDAAYINSIVFVNNYSIPSSELMNAIKGDINKPMTPENISAIRRDIMKYYQNQGFFSAVANVVSQNTQAGELVFEIKEGGRNSIQIEF